MSLKTKINKTIYIMLGLLSAGLILLAPVNPVGAVTADGSSSSSSQTQKKQSAKKTTKPATKSNAGCGSIQTQVISCSDKVGGNPIYSLLIMLVNFLAVGVGIAVVIGVLMGGYKYITSNGNAGQVEDAKKTIANAIIALFLFAFMYAFINFLVPGGVFK